MKPRKAPISHAPRFLVQGRVLGPDAAQWQQILQQVHRSRERPLCLCRPAGVAMYVACHQRYGLKRLPGTGRLHHPSCPSHEAAALPLESTVASAAAPCAAGDPRRVQPAVELAVDFAWTTRGTGARSLEHRGTRGEPAGNGGPRMSLRELLMLLLVRAGFHRWSPAMEGKRSAAVLCKYLRAAARDLVVSGVPLAQRLRVVQPSGIAVPSVDIPTGPGAGVRQCASRSMRARMLVIGEVQRSQEVAEALMLWLSRLPGECLLLEPATWQTVPADLRSMLLSVGRQDSSPVRPWVAALVRQGSGSQQCVDAIAVVPMTATLIPVAELHALPLVDALVAQHRRFAVVLPTDRARVDKLPAIWLLDAGPRAVPLRLASAATAQEMRLKLQSAAVAPSWPSWIWHLDRPMPPLPARC
ncbi:DUF1173 family protein [Comamonadaceae bacterium G21597-S1]|nr:DUF1173 family protein [Comamonadaceae bacterium G21597-S1]